MTILREFTIKDKQGRGRLHVEYQCQSCGKPQITSKYNLTNKPQTICKRCRNQISGIAKRGRPTSKRGKVQPRGELSPRWRGGKYVNGQGYVMVSVKSGSIGRGSGWENYRPEHIVKMETHLGRKLTKAECVHHIDGDRQNNSTGNLVVISTNSHHRQVHMSLQKIGYQFYKEGKITFDKIKNEYIIV